MQRMDTDVLIVGAGPTGLTAALLLQRLGLRYHLVERRPGPQRSPAAHVINARTFEIWRQTGIDLQPLLDAAKRPQDAGSVYWVDRLGGESFGRLPFERQGDELLSITPTPLRNLSQHRLEPLLTRALGDVGGATPSYRREWQSSVEDPDGVRSCIRDDASGATYEVRSRYLIAADGAGSPIRRSLGIQPIGPDRLQCFMMIHFEADLRSLVADQLGVLYWVCDPSCPGIFVAHDIDREWVFMLSWDPATEPRERFDAAYCEAIIRRAMAAEDVRLSIQSISAWTMTAQTAERYRSGRIFLTGDAAHRFPPTGGLGLNTGVQDVHNLIWKIAAVENGWAAPSLLDSYEEERQPIARYNAEQSLTNAARLFEVPLAMGTNDVAEARRNFDEMRKDNSRRQAVRNAIDNQAEHFDMLGLQLGYRYERGALVSDGTAAPCPTNPVREFVASSRPGSRLPHAWIDHRGHRISTLDLIAADRLTLFLGPAASYRIASEAAAFDLPISVLRIGADLEAAEWWSHVAALPDDSALLVRPDQHVMWRTQTSELDAGALGRVLETTLRPSAPSGQE